MKAEEELLIPYIAGIVDGEGCIYMSKRVRNKRAEYIVNVSVGNTYKPLLDSMEKQFRGHVGKAHKGTNAPVYYWRATGKTAYEFLQSIQKYSTIKRKQIDLAIEAYQIMQYQNCHMEDRREYRNRKCLSKRQFEIREIYLQELRRAKLHGKQT